MTRIRKGTGTRLEKNENQNITIPAKGAFQVITFFTNSKDNTRFKLETAVSVDFSAFSLDTKCPILGQEFCDSKLYSNGNLDYLTIQVWVLTVSINNTIQPPEKTPELCRKQFNVTKNFKNKTPALSGLYLC